MRINFLNLGQRLANSGALLELTLLPILWIMYFCSGLIRRDLNLKVYGAPKGNFSDNAKYAFKQNSKSENIKARHYWVSGNKKLVLHLTSLGLNAVNRWSLKGLLICLKAGEYHFSSYASDINFWTSRGATYINYWHGLPLKKIEYDIHNGPLSVRYNPKGLTEYFIHSIWLCARPAPMHRPNKIYCPHPFFIEFFMSAFRVSKGDILENKYPRILYSTKGNKQILTPAKITGLYVPTFRDGDSEWFYKHFITEAESTQKWLEQKDIKLFIKLHPNETTPKKELPARLEILPSSTDIYEVLRSFDFIITDYSSIAIDAADLNIKVFLYWPDVDEYIKESRDFYFDIKQFYSHRYTSNLEQLIMNISTEGESKLDVSSIIKHRARLSKNV